MKIISLLENTTQKCGMEVEHGLSLYIEANGKRILFDMGQSDLFAKNAERLGIDLSEVDVAVISHGHYDHGGGLGCFLSLNSKAPIYLSRHAFGARFNASGKYIGLCDSLCSCERIIYTDGDTQIDENMTLCYADEQRLVRPIEPFGLTEMQNGVLRPDRFLHEQYLLISESGKRVLLSGCSHRGALNIASQFEPDVMIGGFHVSKMPLGDSLAELAQALAKKNTHYYTAHCTGCLQYEFMRKYLPQLDYLACGDQINI